METKDPPEYSELPGDYEINCYINYIIKIEKVEKIRTLVTKLVPFNFTMYFINNNYIYKQDYS